MNPLRLIPRGYRKRAAAVTVLIFVRAVTDLAGIAALIPILVLAADRSALSGNKYMQELMRITALDSETGFIAALCAAVLVFTLLKGIVNIAISQYTSRYILSLYRFYSQRMFGNYRSRGLIFLKNNNTSKLAYEINYVCMGFVQGVLAPIAAMISDSTMLVLMFSALTAYNPKVALMLAALFIPVTAVYILIIRRRIQDYGRQENEIRRTQNRMVLEAFRGYAEIEINDGFGLVEGRFADSLAQISSIRRRYMLVGQIPALLIEICIVAVLSALVLLRTDVVLLGIFAVSAIKVLPSIKGIIAGYITIKNNRYTEQIIAGSAGSPSGSKALRRAVFEKTVEVKNVSFAFPDDERRVLKDFSMTVRKGECIGINGVSGGGKTTLFNLLLGFYQPQSGRILIDGTPLSDIDMRSWRDMIGYVPQEVFIADSTLARNIALGEEEPDRRRVMEALQAASLGDFAESSPLGIDTPMGEWGARLSGGQKQRIGIARALYKGARILFFDEATSALDSDTEGDINSSIKNLSASDGTLTIIIIAHRQSSLAICDRIVTI